MRNGNKFLLAVSAFSFLIILTGYVLFFKSVILPQVWSSFLSAFLLAILNFYAGIFTFRKALNSEKERFSGIVLGGTVIRLMLMLAAVYISLKFLQFRTDVFIFVIFVFYTFYLIAEIFYFYLLRGKIQ